MESCANIFVKKLENNLDKKSFNVRPLAALHALDVICESVMGIKLDVQNGNNTAYVHSIDQLCRISLERALSFWQMSDLLFRFTKNYQNEKRALKVVHKVANDVIKARRKELLKIKNQEKTEENTGNVYKNKKPFLDLLLQATLDGRPLTDEEIRQEVDTFLFAGHDTTATAVSFILYCLANNPDVQEKALEEQNNLFKNNTNPAVTITDLHNMKYLELVIKESLRLYPPVPFFGREVPEDFKYKNEIIPKGATLIIFPMGIQRDPKYFENPEKFDPERFRTVDGTLPYAYIPFSAGPRSCIGQKFAMLELKCVISKVLRKFELHPALPNNELQLYCEAVLKSLDGVNISLRRRKQ